MSQKCLESCSAVLTWPLMRSWRACLLVTWAVKGLPQVLINPHRPTAYLLISSQPAPLPNLLFPPLSPRPFVLPLLHPFILHFLSPFSPPSFYHPPFPSSFRHVSIPKSFLSSILFLPRPYYFLLAELLRPIGSESITWLFDCTIPITSTPLSIHCYPSSAYPPLPDVTLTIFNAAISLFFQIIQ